MEHDVTLHITPRTGGGFFLTGNATGPGGSALKQRDFADESALREFLSGDLGIHAHEVDAAVEALSAGGSHSLHHVMLTAEQIEAPGLGPI